MKLTFDTAPELFAKPLFELDKEEFVELASATGIKFDRYRKTDSDLTFRILQGNGKTLSVTHDKGYNMISTKRPRKMGCAWGGNKSFKDLISIYLCFHAGKVEVTIKADSDDKYSVQERLQLSQYIMTSVLPQ